MNRTIWILGIGFKKEESENGTRYKADEYPEREFV
jgi:hypothetical protein